MNKLSARNQNGNYQIVLSTKLNLDTLNNQIKEINKNPPEIKIKVSIDNKSLEIINSVEGEGSIHLDNQFINTLIDAYPSVKISSKTLVYDNNSTASTAVSEYIINSDAELIVIKKHHRRAFLPLISTQFALKVLFRSEREEKNIPIIQLPVEMEKQSISEKFSLKKLFKK